MTQLDIQELENTIKQVKIIGRLDIQGTGAVETSFTAHTAIQKEKIIVDLSELDFLSSIGIRLLLTAAKAQTRRGGKIVFLNPKSSVEETLVIAGINLLIPIYNDFALALDDLNSSVLG
jgi:anti-anti-sigma factor